MGDFYSDYQDRKENKFSEKKSGIKKRTLKKKGDADYSDDSESLDSKKVKPKKRTGKYTRSNKRLDRFGELEDEYDSIRGTVRFPVY